MAVCRLSRLNELKRNMEYQEVIDNINTLMNREIPVLLALSEEQVSVKKNNQNRTVKMLVGHLIDSASNNHQRMVRLQYAPLVIVRNKKRNKR